MYYFCNFMEKKLVGLDGRGVSSVGISDEITKNVQVSKCFIRNVGGVSELDFVANNETAEGEELDFLGKFSSDKVGCTDKELLSTDNNPIIIVATKKFQVYTGIPTYVKYFPVKGGVIIALIKGYITVESSDGQMLPLSRNCDAVATNDCYTYDSSEIEKLNILKDKESDLLVYKYVVSDCIINHTASRDGSRLKSVKFNRDNFVVLNTKIFEDARVKKAEELKALAEEKKRKAEATAKFNADYRRRMKEEEESKSKPKTTRAKKAPKTTEVASGSEGAKAFLNIVAGL